VPEGFESARTDNGQSPPPQGGYGTERKKLLGPDESPMKEGKKNEEREDLEEGQQSANRFVKENQD